MILRCVYCFFVTKIQEKANTNENAVKINVAAKLVKSIIPPKISGPVIAASEDAK